MPMPVLTIITVTKNCSQTILRTIDSIVKIMNKDIEYLVIDGHSTDGTVALIKQRSDHINLFISEEDFGIYNAMNKGIGYAKGKYVLFLNGDDEILENGFSKIISELYVVDCDICCANTLVEKENGSWVVYNPSPWRLLFYNSIPHPSAFISREILLRNLYTEDFRIAADYEFFLKMFLSRKKFKFVNHVTAKHYKGGASANSILSEHEILTIRKNNLGIYFYLLHLFQLFYRFTKDGLGLKK